MGSIVGVNMRSQASKYLPLVLSVFSILAITTLNAQTQSSKYSIVDLEVLEREKNYQEFLDHAHDILPSNRDQHWINITQNMITGYIEELINKKTFNQKNFKRIEEISRWSVANSAIVQSKRANYGLQYLKICFSDDLIKLTQNVKIGDSPIAIINLIDEDSNECVADLYSMWNNTQNSENDHALAIKLGNLLAQFVQTDKLWSFFAIGAKSQFSEFYCKESYLLQELKKQTAKILSTPNFDNEQIKKKVDNLVNSDCWKMAFPVYKKDLESTELIIFENAFKLLTSFDQLNDEEKDYYYTRYLLSDPPNGELFNYAWNAVQLLGQKFERRTKILKKVEGLDPLPGKSFKSVDLSRREILISFIGKNLPEYIDSYGKTCIDYLKGRESFPNGNPTIECHELFRSNSKAIKQGLRNEYVGLIKF